MSIAFEEFLRLRNDHPVVDVRSEGEFTAGHIRGAINIPLLNDTERAIVGTAYRQHGQREAIKEGFRLVGPRLNDIVDAAERAASGRELLVHCWRGGMRSGNFCRFAAMANIRSQSLTGGYKAYRENALASFGAPIPLRIIAGLTGSGKSEILRALAARGEQILDLEHLARHKGSAFGGLFMPAQPTTEQFQNELYEEILKLDLSRRVWIEDESLSIGRIFLPVVFWNRMKVSPLAEIEVAKSVRVERLVNEYGAADPVEFLEIMGKLVKRLGGQHYADAREKLLKGDMASTIEILLTYYDKTYRESVDKRASERRGKINWDGKSAVAAAVELIQMTN